MMLDEQRILGSVKYIIIFILKMPGPKMEFYLERHLHPMCEQQHPYAISFCPVSVPKEQAEMPLLICFFFFLMNTFLDYFC